MTSRNSFPFSENSEYSRVIIDRTVHPFWYAVRPVTFYVSRLYRERITQIEAKLSEVRSGKSVEYLQPLEELQVNMKNRMEVGNVLRELRLENIRCKYEAEIIANEQNFQVRGSRR